MTVNLNAPQIGAGPLTAADLDRATNQGRIYRLHRVTVCPPCDGLCNQGRDCAAESCAAEGGMHAEPAPTKPRPGIGIALVIAPWLAGVIGWALYVRWAA